MSQMKNTAYMRCPLPSDSIKDLPSLVDQCKAARCIGLEPDIDFDDRPASCVLLVAAIVASQNATGERTLPAGEKL